MNLFKIDWKTPLTKGRAVYAGTIGTNRINNINYESGFFIGWDRWSDAHIDWFPRIQKWMGL